jgi:LemA protein
MPKKSIVVAGGIVLVALVVLVWFFAVNNQLVSLQEGYRAAWAQVETVLQRRFDLIPNLVNTVKGYAAHEKTVLEEVSRYRSQWASARTPEAKASAASLLEGSLGRLIAVAEQYPDLKASTNFRDLQNELAGTENRISVERQRYNDAARQYNTRVRQFPASVVASMRGFRADAPYFEAAKPAQEAPKVDFSTGGGA